MNKIPLFLLVAFLLSACKKDGKQLAVPKFSKVLILGNSITYAPANPAIGWNNNWGMAATDSGKDYVHLLAVKFSLNNSGCITIAKNIVAFETGFQKYDMGAELKRYLDDHPDLIIIRIGENVNNGFDQVAFDSSYATLINYLKTGNPDVKIIAAGSFWSGKVAVDKIMKKYSPFISLSALSGDPSNSSWGLYANYSLQEHPSDKGMQAISNMIWNEIGTQAY